MSTFINCSFNGATPTHNCSHSDSGNTAIFGQPFAMKVGKMAAYIGIAFVAFLGNILVIIIICRNKHLRKTINYFILNMAISDLFIPIIIIPIRLYSLSIETAQTLTAWPIGGDLGDFLCKLAIFLADSSPVISIMSLVLMTVDRFYAVVFPLKAQRVSCKTRIVLLVCSWLLAFLFYSPYFKILQIKVEANQAYCVMNWEPTSNHERSMLIYTTIACVLFTIIPFLLLSVMYSIMLLMLKKQSIAKPQAQTAYLIRRKRNTRNIVLMALVIVLVFAVCYGPYNVFIFFLSIVWKWKLPASLTPMDFDKILFVISFLTSSNAALNPCIYFIFIQNYRAALKLLICGKPTHQPVKDLTSLLSQYETELQLRGNTRRKLATNANKPDDELAQCEI